MRAPHLPHNKRPVSKASEEATEGGIFAFGLYFFLSSSARSKTSLSINGSTGISIHSPWLRRATVSVLGYFHCGEEARAATHLPLLDQFERTLQPDIL